MFCYICEKYPKYFCQCIIPGCFICSEHSEQHLSESGEHQFRGAKNFDLSSILIKDLKSLKLKAEAKGELKFKKLLEKMNNSCKGINNCIAFLEENCNSQLISDINLLKMLNGLKNLDFVSFDESDFENKYFYKVLQEDDGIYKGKVEIGPNDDFIKQGKGKKIFQDGGEYEGE